MALFSRRFLQRVLDESAAYLSLKQREDICQLLNTVRDDYLATEWELALLHTASKQGTIRYETNVGGERRPDFLFCGDAGLEFVAEIRAVSDRGLHKQNPVEALQEEFWRWQRKFGLIGGFDLHVDGYGEHLYRGSGKKPRLKLPKVSEFGSKVFNAEFRRFMELVRQSPEVHRVYEVKQQHVSVRISYNPSRRGFGGGSHPSFAHAAVIDQNPVYHALRDKAAQLKLSGFTGTRGIFLCDAGCQIMHDRRSHWASYTIDEVVQHFLRQHLSVSFVVLFAVQDESSSFGRKVRRFIEHSIYFGREIGSEKDSIGNLVTAIAASLPIPVQSPINAMLHLRRTEGMTGRHLGSLVHGGSVEMSARMLLEIMSAVMTVEDFERNYRMNGAENPFRRMLSQGRLIKEVVVEPHPESDDDRVTIHFGAPDPAIAPFRVKA